MAGTRWSADSSDDYFDEPDYAVDTHCGQCRRSMRVPADTPPMPPPICWECHERTMNREGWRIDAAREKKGAA